MTLKIIHCRSVDCDRVELDIRICQAVACKPFVQPRKGHLVRYVLVNIRVGLPSREHRQWCTPQPGLVDPGVEDVDAVRALVDFYDHVPRSR